jgi:hypothetical protein
MGAENGAQPVHPPAAEPASRNENVPPPAPAGRSLVDHPRFKLVIALLGATLTLVGIVSGIFAIVRSNSSPGPSTTSPSVTTTSETPTTATASSESRESPVEASQVATAPTGDSVLITGTCLDGSMASVPCTAIHRFEVVAQAGSSCDVATAMAYLGGNKDLDVLRADVEQMDGACLVSGMDDPDRTSAIEGIFAAPPPAADPFRLCRDDRVAATEVSCDVPHTGEIVGVPAGSVPDQAGCEAAASAYLSLSFNRVSDRLKVVTLSTTDPNDGQPRCVITVRGNELLTASLRNIRTNALPMVAG